MNLKEFWEGRVGAYRDKVYLYFQDQEITYGELDRKSNQVGNGFLELGIRKGENISALEVETVINSHPKVLESAVIGVPSPSGFGDEEVKAYVVLKAAEDLPYHELIEFLSQELAHFKIPRYIECRADLPKNPAGRVTKEVLKKERADLTIDCYDREKEK